MDWRERNLSIQALRVMFSIRYFHPFATIWVISITHSFWCVSLLGIDFRTAGLEKTPSIRLFCEIQVSEVSPSSNFLFERCGNNSSYVSKICGSYTNAIFMAKLGSHIDLESRGDFIPEINWKKIRFRCRPPPSGKSNVSKISVFPVVHSYKLHIERSYDSQGISIHGCVPLFLNESRFGTSD